MDTSVINEFLKEWPQSQDFYEAIARKARDICVTSLQQHGIRCSAQYRVKEAASLKRKLYARQKAKSQPYESKADVQDDIVDLAGVRIRLYFPQERRAVGRILYRAFTVTKKKTFPEPANRENTAMAHDGDHEYQSGGNSSENDEPNEKDYTLDTLPAPSSGYSADHYHVNLKLEDCRSGRGWHTGRIEIQVVSMIRHVWAEVEHDLLYKNLAVAGDAERLVLNGLNGAIHLAEGFLNQLYNFQRFNGPFETAYHLGSYLLQCMQVKMGCSPEDEMSCSPEVEMGCSTENLGEVDLLWQLLRATGLNGRQQFRKFLEKMDFSVRSQGLSPVTVGRLTLRPTIVNYIMDEIVRSAYGERAVAAQFEARQSRGKENEYRLEAIIDSFILVSHLFSMEEWVALVINTTEEAAWNQVIEMAEWLRRDEPWKFYNGQIPLDRTGKDMIDRLWAHFESHDQRAMQMVFRLARLGVVKTRVADKTRLVPALQTLIDLK